MATTWTVGTRYTPTNFVRTGAAPGTYYENETWGISSSNPGTLKEIRDINGEQWGDFGFASGSGWAKLSDMQFTPTATTNTIATPTTSGEVSPFLNDIQDTAFSLADSVAPQSDAEIMQEIETMIQPSSEMPETPNLVDLYGELQVEYGIEGLNTAIGELDNQILAEQDALDIQRFTEEGRPVAMSVIAGRIGEQERTAMQRINFLSRQKNYYVNQLNAATNAISTIINLTNTDYNNAMERYNTEFSQNLQMYNAFTEAKDTQFSQAMQLQGVAIANLGIYSELITSGNMTYDSLDANTKLQINKLELQAGLPVGFLSQITADNANGEILTTTTRTDASGMKYADTLMRMPDGSMKVVTTALGQELLPEYATKSSTDDTDEEYEKAIEKGYSKAAEIIAEVDKTYNTIDGQLVESYNETGDTKLSAQEIDKAIERIAQEVTAGDVEMAVDLFNRIFKDYTEWTP